MGWKVLEELEGDGEDDWTDHHADAEDYVFWEVDSSVGDIRLGERLHIRGGLADGHVVGPHDATQSDDEPK